MLSERDLSAAIGTTAYDPEGHKIGTVEHFLVDDRTGAPTWVAVTTGLFGTRHSVVPAHDAAWTDGALRLPVSRDTVKHAPAVADTTHLDAAAEEQLRRHYAIDTGPGTGGSGRDLPPGAADRRDDGTSWSPTRTGEVPVGAVHGGDEPPGPVAVPEHEIAAARAGSDEGRQPSGRTDDGSITRSEQRLHVGTERVPVARVRLVKYVVTEEVQVTVPVRREEVRLEEVPLDDDGTSAPGESLVPPGADTGTGLPEEIVLHAERPVVGVEVVPVERVRLRVDMVPGEEQVTERVEREQIVVDRD